MDKGTLQRLAVAGFQLPETAETQVESARRQAACDRAHAAWRDDEPISWPDIDIPPRPLSLSELFAITDSVSFTLRRASDGYRSSRSAIVAATTLAERLRSARRAALREASVDRNEVELRRIVIEVSYLLVGIVPELIRYFRSRPVPSTAGDPDGWASEEEAVAYRRDLLQAFADAHDDVDRALQTSDYRRAQRQRAVLFANRVLLTATVHQLEKRNESLSLEELLGTMTIHRVEEAKTLMSSFVGDGRDEADSDGATSALLLNACAVVEMLWQGDPDGFRAVCESIARLDLPTDMKVKALASCVASASSDDVRRDMLIQLLEIIEEEPLDRQRQLRASIGELVLAALAQLAPAMPTDTSAIAGRYAGFGSDRMRWASHHRHVWLIPGLPAVAILDHGSNVETITLDTLEYETIAELTEHHAEEHEIDNDTTTIRRLLSHQLRTLGHRLADLDEPLSFYAFGHLKHIPLPALTGRQHRLARRPGLFRLAHRRADINRDTSASVRGDRVFVVDEDFPAFRQVSTQGSEVFRFDSSDESAEGIPEAFEQLTSGAKDVIFFGHGYVDQFDSRHLGLVTRVRGDGAGFVPAGVFSGFDLRSTQLAIIMSCGSGQGNVFLEPNATVADGFSLGGALAVIAPTWPVRSDYAAEFLRKLLGRIDDGESVLAAWGELLDQDPNRFCSMCLFAD